ncbi:MAG: WD40 repeat domain-containing protein [Bdellovibrionaceae bacterium]|nr:WD40 repeat domain-containing protein [Pseudobdellovibrionaceae bacterium]
MPGNDGLRLIDFSTGTILQSFAGAESVQFSADGTLLYVTSQFSSYLKIVNAKDGKLSSSFNLKLTKNEYKAAAISKDNTRVLVSFNDRVALYDLLTGSILSTTSISENFSTDWKYSKLANISSDGTKYYTISLVDASTYTVSIFSTKDGVEIARIPVTISQNDFYKYVSVSFLSDNNKLLIQTDSSANVWSVNGTAPLVACTADKLSRVSNDLSELMSANYSNYRLVIRDANNCTTKSTIASMYHSFLTYANRGTSDDNSLVLLHALDHSDNSYMEHLTVYSAVTGKSVLDLAHKSLSLSSKFAISPDNKLLVATLRGPDAVKVYNLATGLEVQDLTSLTPELADYTFSPDGKFIIGESTNNKRIVLERF